MSDNFYSVPPFRMPVGKGNGLTRGQAVLHKNPKPKLPKAPKKSK